MPRKTKHTKKTRKHSSRKGVGVKSRKMNVKSPRRSQRLKQKADKKELDSLFTSLGSMKISSPKKAGKKVARKKKQKKQKV